MASTQPPWSIPYPVGSDRIMDGDNAMQAIADRTHAILTGNLGVQAFSTNVVNLPVSAGSAWLTHIGKTCEVWALFDVSGTGGPGWASPMPRAPLPGFSNGMMVVGTCRLMRSGISFYTGFVVCSGDINVTFSEPNGNAWGGAIPATTQPGDKFSYHYSYPTNQYPPF